MRDAETPGMSGSGRTRVSLKDLWIPPSADGQRNFALGPAPLDKSDGLRSYALVRATAVTLALVQHAVMGPRDRPTGSSKLTDDGLPSPHVHQPPARTVIDAPRLRLASASPRRKQLLESLGLEFEVAGSGLDETRLQGEAPTAYAERVAREKAIALAEPGWVVVAADTIVVHRGVVMGKPAHPTEARGMLERLSGERHTVISGVAVATWDAGPVVRAETARTVVEFADLTSEEIAAYVATGEPMDKAGAYGLQGAAGAFVVSVEGSPSNVVGFPLPLVVRLLRASGILVLGQTS